MFTLDTFPKITKEKALQKVDTLPHDTTIRKVPILPQIRDAVKWIYDVADGEVTPKDIVLTSHIGENIGLVGYSFNDGYPEEHTDWIRSMLLQIFQTDPDSIHSLVSGMTPCGAPLKGYAFVDAMNIVFEAKWQLIGVTCGKVQEKNRETYPMEKANKKFIGTNWGDDSAEFKKMMRETNSLLIKVGGGAQGEYEYDHTIKNGVNGVEAPVSIDAERRLHWPLKNGLSREIRDYIIQKYNMVLNQENKYEYGK